MSLSFGRTCLALAALVAFQAPALAKDPASAGGVAGATDRLGEQVSALETDLAAAQIELFDHHTYIEIMEGAIASLERGIRDHHTFAEIMQGAQAKMGQDLTALHAEVEALKTAGKSVDAVLSTLKGNLGKLDAKVAAMSADVAAQTEALRALKDAVAVLQQPTPTLAAYADADGSIQTLNIFVGNGPTMIRSNVEGMVAVPPPNEAEAIALRLLNGGKEECWDVFSTFDRAKQLTTPMGKPITFCVRGRDAGDTVPAVGEISVGALEFLGALRGVPQFGMAALETF